MLLTSVLYHQNLINICTIPSEYSTLLSLPLLIFTPLTHAYFLPFTPLHVSSISHTFLRSRLRDLTQGSHYLTLYSCFWQRSSDICFSFQTRHHVRTRVWCEDSMTTRVLPSSNQSIRFKVARPAVCLALCRKTCWRMRLDRQSCSFKLYTGA